jgi:gliding motility-associated-like protein
LPSLDKSSALMNKIYTLFSKLLFLLGLFAYSIQSIAQVTSRDSLALVSLYNSTAGPQWNTHTNWLSGSVSTWYGVHVLNSRVSQLVLPSNNITGIVTDSLRNLDSLTKVDFSGNKLTAFPALTTAHLDTLSLQNNKLTFKDLVPNKAHADSFYYAPQDSVDTYLDTTAIEQTSVFLVTRIDYSPPVGDNYQWFQGTTPLVTSISNTYTITCMDSSRVGTYGCVITNLQLSRLTLYRRLINLKIQKLANPGSDFHVCSSNSTLQGILPAGDSIIWSVVSGGASIAYDTSAITAVNNLTVGANVFMYSVSANSPSCPAHTYSTALLTVTRDTNPSPAYAGVDQSICGPQVILHADTPSIGRGAWTVTRGMATVAQPNGPSTAANGLIPGQNIFRWQIVNGACAPAFFDEVIVFRDDTLGRVYAGRDTSICQTAYDLSAVLPANTNGVWSVASGAGTFTTIDSPHTQVTNLNEFLNRLTWTVSNTCNSVTASVNVTVYNFVVANAGPDQHIFYSPINTYTIGDTLAIGTGGNGQFSYVWSPSTNIDSPDAEHPHFLTPDAGTFNYTVTVTDGHGCTASASVSYIVTKNEFLVVPTLFTPNGDGLNDELYIPGIESYPHNELTVADRNDQIVYKKTSYKNDWQGTNELGFSQQGQKLPADTYFYTLKLEDGKTVQTGFFLIKY